LVSRGVVFVCILGLLVIPCGFGFCQSEGQKDNTASTSRADDSEVPEANPARPTVTNPASLPPVGYLQFEQGFVQANISPGLDRQFSINQVTKIAVHPHAMFEFLTQPFAASVTHGEHARAEGDLQVGAQIVLVKQAGRSPTVAAGYIRRVRGGHSADLDVGGFSQSALVLASGDLGQFHYDTNFVVSEQQSGAARRPQFGETLSVTHPLPVPKWTLTGELWRFSQPFVIETVDAKAHPRSNAAATLWALAYSPKPNLIIDLGFEHGLTVTSTRWQGIAGFTYLLPHRLWKRAEPAARQAGD
jgi:hypothetical protein